MALIKSRFRDDIFRDRDENRRRFDDLAIREPIWHDRFLEDWPDWPSDWPRPRDVVERFWRDTEKWWQDWPKDWPKMDSIMPQFSSNLDKMDPAWRKSDFWRNIYPKWAEPIFKEGLDVKTDIKNDEKRFAVEIDAYQFKPEELQVKTLDDTLIIEGRHEDIKDQDNFTKMHFVRKYQLPRDVEPQSISSSIDSNGRLTVEAQKRYLAIDGKERSIPIESPSHRFGGLNYSPRGGERQEADRDSLRRQEDRSTLRDGYERRHEVIQDRGRSSPMPPPPANDYRRSEFEKREANENEMRYAARREEFREEFRDARNGFLHPENGHRNGHEYRSTSRPRESDFLSQNGNGIRHEHRRGSDQRQEEQRNGGSRQEYRVDTPGSRQTRDDDNRSESRAEEMRSVRILRKTFN